MNLTAIQFAGRIPATPHGPQVAPAFQMRRATPADAADILDLYEGLGAESRELFALARQASGESRGRGWDFRFYKLLAALTGWSRLGRISCYLDGFRR